MPKKLDRCVKHVEEQNRRRKKKANPWAVCNASLNRKRKPKRKK